MEFPIEISADLPLENAAMDSLGSFKMCSSQETDSTMEDIGSNKSSSSSEESIPKLSVRDMIQRFNIAAEAAKAGHSLDKRKLKSRSPLNLSSIGLSTCKTKSHDIQKTKPDQSTAHVTRRQSQLSFHIRNTFIETKETEVVVEKNSIEPVESDINDHNKEIQHINSHLKMYSIKESQNDGLVDTSEQIDDELNMEYQSKTTITRTTNGVRIVIDLLFDPSKAVMGDIVGNRIETTLPQSRILNEFQERVNKSTSTSPTRNTLTYDASHC